MNYRHSFHAGNFADVVKHAVLTRIVEYLKRKDAAFRVIDTHAGTGMYDLSGDDAGRTGEWQGGIGKVFDRRFPRDAANLLAPYLDAVRAASPEGGLRFYPGSPWIVRHLLRRQDRLSAIELDPQAAAALKALFAGDIQVRVTELDGWLALGAHVPPKERRGLVLVDPPFELPGEFARLLFGLETAHRRWPGGIYALWYPIKERKAVNAFRATLSELGIPKIIDVVVEIRQASAEPRLDGCGLAVVNPPYTLEEELRILLPALTSALADGQGAKWRVDRLAA